jgi:hypothetical protein
MMPFVRETVNRVDHCKYVISQFSVFLLIWPARSFENLSDSKKISAGVAIVVTSITRRFSSQPSFFPALVAAVFSVAHRLRSSFSIRVSNIRSWELMDVFRVRRDRVRLST